MLRSAVRSFPFHVSDNSPLPAHGSYGQSADAAGIGPKTPTAAMNASTTTLQPFHVGSPEIDYFRGALAARARQSSRWKEDWEELEMLGKGAFGSVVKARNKVDNRVYAGPCHTSPSAY